MGVVRLPSTMVGCVTPICEECGIHLCYDIDNDEYQLDKAFWDKWRCKECNESYRGQLKIWHQFNAIDTGSEK